MGRSSGLWRWMTSEAAAAGASTLCCLPFPPSSVYSQLDGRRFSTATSTSFSRQEQLVAVSKDAAETSAGRRGVTTAEDGRHPGRRDVVTGRSTTTTTTSTTPSSPTWIRAMTATTAVAQLRSRALGVNRDVASDWTLMTSLLVNRRDAERRRPTICRITSAATTMTSTTTGNGQIVAVTQRPKKRSPNDEAGLTLPPTTLETRSVAKDVEEYRRTRQPDRRQTPVGTTSQARRRRSSRRKIRTRIIDELTSAEITSAPVGEDRVTTTMSQLTVSFFVTSSSAVGREAARRFVSLNISLSHSRSLKVIRNNTLD